MKTVKVKICGITREADLQIVTDFGSDAVGFVVDVPSSPRNLSHTDAKKLMAHVPLFVKRVVVTIPPSIDALQQTCEQLSPDAVQLHGPTQLNVSPLQTQYKHISFIRSVKADPFTGVAAAAFASRSFDAIHLDSLVPGKHGGTGVIHDWSLSKQVKRTIHPKPLILAGGLNPENVATAIRTVQPYAVDVSTGVESTPGVKDPKAVSAFIEAAKNVKMSNG